MKNYSKYLSSGEEIVKVFGISTRYYFTKLLLLLPFSLVLVGLPSLMKLLELKRARTYILTDRRVMVKHGFFSIQVTSAPYDRISHITVEEKFVERFLFGSGDLILQTIGQNPVKLELEKIADPFAVKKTMEELITKEKSLLGVYQQGENSAENWERIKINP